MNHFQGATALLAALLNDPQNNRLLKLNFPRGGTPAGRLMLANSLDADEGVSRDFTYTVEVLSDDASIPLKDVMGRMVTVSLVRDDGTLRYFNGYVFEFRFLRTDGGFAFYQMVLKPWLAYLRLKYDSKVFQGLTLSEVCEQIFGSYLERDYRFLTVRDLPVATMLVQYKESDHNHLHRRLEAVGLHYWYEHRRDGHTLCLSDDSTLAEALEGNSDIEYQSQAGAQEDDGIHAWSAMRRIGAGSVTLGSYDFKNAQPSWADRPSLNKQGAVPVQEVYEFTGAYGFKDDSDGEAQAKMRMKEIDARGQDFEASSNTRNIHPRRSMTLAGHFSGGRRRVGPGEDMPEDKARRDYLVLAVRHSVTNNYQDGRAAESRYRNEFTCMRRDIPWLPGRGYHSTDTRIYGVQTATVVGPQGEEIYTDEYGRIKLQFHWDREGKSDAGSSAFVRVMTSWAGSHFGAISIPRVGQEVVVTFIDGNCDRPLVIGSVYNANNMPPWELPSNKTQSGILTRSTKRGSEANASALRFEDRKGAEELWLHAERDQRIEVEHDEVQWVGNDRKKTIDHDEIVEVKHDRTETVGHDETITVHNNRTERVDHDESIDIGDNREEMVGKNECVKIGGNRTEQVSLTKEETIGLSKVLTIGTLYNITVGTVMHTLVTLSQYAEILMNKGTKVGKKYDIEVGQAFEVTVGSASLKMSKDGEINISGTRITIGASGPVQINGKDVDIN